MSETTGLTDASSYAMSNPFGLSGRSASHCSTTARAAALDVPNFATALSVKAAPSRVLWNVDGRAATA